MKSEFQGIIRIKQVPNMKGKNPDDFSWLINPFMDNRVYGTKFTIDLHHFSWKLFIKEKSRDAAKIRAFTFLDSLKEIYPGLSGEVTVKPINPKSLNKNELFLEYVLPQPPFAKKIYLLRKIINLFSFKNSHIVKVYLLWQRDDSMEKFELQELELFKENRRVNKIEDVYKLKVYISVEMKSDNQLDKEGKISELDGHLNNLKTYIENVDGKRASIKEAPKNTLKNILEGEVFWKNLSMEDTGRFYSRKKGEIPKEKMPAFVTPDIIDLNIPEDFPLDKAIEVRNENIGFSKDKKDYIKLVLGDYLHKGVVTSTKVLLSIDDLVHHEFISGLTGVGKSVYLQHLAYEISIKAPNVGLLVINLYKKEEEQFYNSDIVLNYGDPKFRVPYFFKGEVLEETLEQLAAILISSVGLKNVVETNMYNVMMLYYKKHQRLPESLKILFDRLLYWFQKHPYHIKYQTNIMRAIKNRAIKLLSSSILNHLLRLPSKVPNWFKDWMNGKNVFINLASCNMSTKRLIVNLIFQMIRTFFPEAMGNKLKNLIILDEVSQILEKPKTHFSDDDEFVSKHQLETVFTEFLQAFRSRGISLVLAEQKPSRLFESVYSLPSILVLFRTAHSCSHLFTNNIAEQDDLAILEKRRAIIFDGVNGRKFSIRTVDFYFQNPLSNNRQELENLCPSCKSLISSCDKFCSVCGDQLISEKKPDSDEIKESTKEASKIEEDN